MASRGCDSWNRFHLLSNSAGWLWKRGKTSSTPDSMTAVGRGRRFGSTSGASEFARLHEARGGCRPGSDDDGFESAERLLHVRSEALAFGVVHPVLEGELEGGHAELARERRGGLPDVTAAQRFGERHSCLAKPSCRAALFLS